ncbi:MAG: GIY-YIG nuclease family protein [Candidatus Komeilibacteria bacterium]|nr:GIY-YIG nuclease family protein [Candidatus Komeilibacteria bacterium]
MHYVYILKSNKDNHLYYGYTNNLKQRLNKHQEGKVFATKLRLPVRVLYYEAYMNEDDARARERYFKTGWGRNYIKKLLINTLKQ